MTDPADRQRARRFIIEAGLTRREFFARFPAQFVENNYQYLDRSGAFEIGDQSGTGPSPMVVVTKSEPKLTKRITISHHYYSYNLKTHRIAGKWHGKRTRSS